MQINFRSIYQTTIKARVDKVWDALINPEIVRQYFFGSSQETDWKIGSQSFGLENMKEPLTWIKELFKNLFQTKKFHIPI
ncbi:activator of Hsp90 ATPase-like protein [Anseongella ginsenosidimutans]|uniref:Activator of Hsp90 ATPase-like protein n=1 Tax=Anseongella ginsenosidimutans TaxID=496056 RepID=A0A4R3KUF4_9SPHI|nr:hypothetical protein FRZ59_12245 [Anseongella ginsenosidimutans]TCS87435.1 activator of Hsp90 ATPase-like protein [Anseongella ginsenosidimutans]